jgi:hypothetical protein
MEATETDLYDRTDKNDPGFFSKSRRHLRLILDQFSR